MNSERDKFLTEKMGECWHEGYFDSDENIWVGECEQNWNNNFSKWEGFGKLINWCRKQEFWSEDVLLWKIYVDEEDQNCGGFFIDERLVDPNIFADFIYNLLKDEESGV